MGQSTRSLDLRPVDLHADPLIGALIEKLPRGGAWPIEQRLVWLRMAAMAFDLAYGAAAPIDIGHANALGFIVADPPMIGVGPNLPGVGPNLGKQQRAPDQKFIVCLDGMAWGPDNKLILPSALSNGDTLWDFRPGEQPLERVVWADGETREPHQLPPLQVFKG